MNSRYYVNKIGMAFLTIMVCSLLTFILFRMMPGDVFDVKARDLAVARGLDYNEAKILVTRMYNYDPTEPVLKQMSRYYSALFHGNLGTSMTNSSITVNEIITYYMPWTLFLVSIALTLSYFLGIWLGSLMAWRRKSILSSLIAAYATIVNAIPPALVPTFVLSIFAFGLGWFPIQGAYSIQVNPGFNWQFIKDVLWHAALPVFAYTCTQINTWVMNMKGSCIGVMAEDYVTAAYARGLSDRIIRQKYVKKNALLPLYTALAISFGAMLGGATYMEGPFVYPGIGSQLGKALGNRDFTVCQGLLLITTAATVLASLFVDFLMPKLDPRIKMED
ncbi:ABC transporter permease [Anaerocolumna sp. MB42-C2]|uniref:ABC transporter permease n=1 Tax=Anaerocolumna sp. MB42-C2 TaxID=3070997 RepID=UPI0027E16D85|nr:ABC transporter permease [Anaerocolumna sp. MB42-C2]WMJ88640.1 ABC transporter permease [Anaerocolumna sp. MB42-C2]